MEIADVRPRQPTHDPAADLVGLASIRNLRHCGCVSYQRDLCPKAKRLRHDMRVLIAL